MPFGRKFLKSIGLNEDQIESVVEAHIEVTNAQKATIAELTDKASKLDELQKELESLRGKADFESKYNAKAKEFEDYKASVETEKRESAIKSAYRDLLVAEHVGERQLDAIIRATNFKDMKLGSDGKLENVDALKEAIKKDWSGFISTEHIRGAEVSTPPGGDNNHEANGRAAELAKKFHEQRYGKPKTE